MKYFDWIPIEMQLFSTWLLLLGLIVMAQSRSLFISLSFHVVVNVTVKMLRVREVIHRTTQFRVCPWLCILIVSMGDLLSGIASVFYLMRRIAVKDVREPEKKTQLE